MNQPISSRSRYYCLKAFQGPSHWANRFSVIPLLIGLCSFALATLQGRCIEVCDSNTHFGITQFFTFGNGVNNSVFGADTFDYPNSNTTNSNNTATGYSTLSEIYHFVANATTATGALALGFHEAGDSNTATGYLALHGDGDFFGAHRGSWNTATGVEALSNDLEADYNTAIGYAALRGSDDGNVGSRNTVIGAAALYSIEYGWSNTANGTDSLFSTDASGSNTATGSNALYYNVTGSLNTAGGIGALGGNTTGGSNTAVGFSALAANTTGSRTIALGESAVINLTTGSDNIEIGHKGNAGETKTIRIGTKGTQTKTVIAGINGTTVAGGIGVLIDANGQLGTATSSTRFKEAIEPMDKASEAIHALKPVTFRYKKELDPEGIPQFGLIAEEVEKINPALVAHDDQGKPYTVRYDAVNAMLLNEFLKDARKGKEQEAAIAEVESTVARHDKAIAQQQQESEALRASIKEQATQLQKVSARVEARHAMSRLVAND